MAAPRSSTCACVNDSGSPRGDAQLLDDEIDARDRFGHAVLDLDARVDLEQIELAAVEQELDRAGVEVVRGRSRP